ncbi:MDR family MFS transporter [Exiguobacterium alkaliphilum]|uniref:MDR family MFS transporter n=1 Tax=Exiguobacterium alkaliphilum TaxID=1428684 RepID=UPI001BAA938B|nr:MFS transporter [Exiguobacterium alkaliphilum]QUE85314.1 MFS transporter [Exiguobacterium alkaliphilum]
MYQSLKRLDRNIWIRFLGETITGVMMFMIAPFLVLYYSDKLDSYVQVGVILATGPIMALIGSVVGGRLADLYGRKPVMMTAIVGDALALVGFAFADTFWPLLLLNAMLGLTNSLFHPAASAMVADVTEPEQLNEAFGLLRMGHNIGAAFGPLLGSAVLFLDRQYIFIAAAVVFGLYALVLAKFIRETLPETTEHETLSNQDVLRVFSQDRVFLVFIFAGVFISMGFAIVESMLPLFLRESLPTFTDRQNPFAYLLALNGIMVVLFQFPIASKLGQKPFGNVMLAGATVFGVGMMLLAVVPRLLYSLGTPYLMLVSVLLAVYAFYTLGEMIMSPVQQTFIAMIAPENMRGAYNGAASIQWLIGGVTAPLFASLFFNRGAGHVALLLVGAASCVSGLIYWQLGRRVRAAEAKQKTA